MCNVNEYYTRLVVFEYTHVNFPEIPEPIPVLHTIIIIIAANIIVLVNMKKNGLNLILLKSLLTNTI